MIKKVARKVVVKILKRRGFSSWAASECWESFWKDLWQRRDVPLKQKLWAYKRGFFSDRIHFYGLTEQNYHRYIPDFDYYKLHPLNGIYAKWIDDKLTMRYVFSKYADYMPAYYYELRRDGLIRLADNPFDSAAKPSFAEVCELARMKGELAIKPWCGTGGDGFHKLSFREDALLWDGQPATPESAAKHLSRFADYIVTEYVRPHSELSKIYPVTSNCLRLMVICDPQEGPMIISAFIRFGVKSSGMVDNVRAGGIYCGIKLDSGDLFQPYQITDGRVVDVRVHPDTGVDIQGVIPHWDIVKNKIKQIAGDFTQLVYCGYDVIVTETGFKFIEINSHQDPYIVQQYTPFLENQYCRRLFLNQNSETLSH